jgi:hypothetical protein
MKKQALLWLVPVILLAGVFSGCDNGGGGGVDGGATPNPPRKPPAVTTPEPKDDDVIVLPGTVTLRAGLSQQFTAALADGGDVTFTWSLSGGLQAGTAIDPESGLLSVDAEEGAESLEVTAAADGKDGTALVYIAGNGGVPEERGIALTPNIITLGRGAAQTFKAVFSADGSDADNSDLMWDVTSGPSVMVDGVLTVGGSEGFPKLVVSAETADGKRGTAIVYIDGNDGILPPGGPFPKNLGVEVTPPFVTLEKGESKTFTQTGADNFVWFLSGALASGLIGSTLTVEQAESASKIEVTVWEREDPLNKYGTAVVTVRGNEKEPAVVNDGLTVETQDAGAQYVSVVKGKSPVTFIAKDSGGNVVSSGLTWRLLGGGVVGTTLTGGELKVPLGETAKYLSVRAETSDGSSTGTAVVTLLDQELEFTALSVDGAAGSRTTTELTLTFSAAITGLTAKDISISAANGSMAQVSRAGSLIVSDVSDSTYTLPVAVSRASGAINVSVSKRGYSISPASREVTVHTSFYPSRGKSLKAEFGANSVAAAFNAVSNYVQSGFTSGGTDRIQLGDYIDLEDGLTVAAYNGSGAVSINPGTEKGEASWPIYTTDTMYHNPDYKSVYLRLIVVGINSFKDRNGNSKDHVVFQFQNMPVKREMNSSSTNLGGYEASEMRRYLTPVPDDSASGNFLAGLIAAGVPEGALWAPKRVMAKEYSGAETVEIEDKLWLPTEREMYGMRNYSNDSAETEANQGRLDYYYNGAKSTFARRMKHRIDMLNDDGTPTDYDGWGYLYWEASAAYSLSYFSCVSSSGSTSFYNASSTTPGVAPAFCISGPTP